MLAGRPGNGKSSLAINIAKSLIERDLKVAFFSREMTKEALMSKIVANELRINSHRFRGNIDNKLKVLIEETQETFSNNLKNLLIIDDVWALDETISIIKDYKPDVFVDDYIQLAKGSPLQEKRFEIEEILLEYKRSCKLINSHGIIISQMNREIEKRLTFTPMMSDLAESAALEHAAELLAFILYPHVNNPSVESPHRSLLFIKKSRYGQVGTYEFGYRGEFCKYYDSVEEAANDSPRDY